MNRPMTGPDPWRAPVTVAHIPDTGLHRELEAAEQASFTALAAKMAT